MFISGSYLFSNITEKQMCVFLCVLLGEVLYFSEPKRQYSKPLQCLVNVIDVILFCHHNNLLF